MAVMLTIHIRRTAVLFALSAILAMAQTSPGRPAPDSLGATAPRTPLPDDYRIGPGDTLQISVWREPEASVPSAVVRPDGYISMPLLKQIEVAGVTPTELERKITERLTEYINAPDVTVVVAQINSKRVYIVGAARREGPLAYTYRMTVMQALSEAGGLTDYAKRKKIYVLRAENGKEYQLPFNYDEVIRGERTEQNIQLLPGDTIIIPR
jgi:polysaccharide biosynthesis/export protein